MDESEQRQMARDSLFVLADMRLPGMDTLHRIKVRNLSPAGMMGEGAVRVVRGSPVSVNIRNAGWVDGTVAWVQENRFGVAFCEEIDPKLPRTQSSSDSQHHTPRYLLDTIRKQSRAGGALRKV